MLASLLAIVLMAPAAVIVPQAPVIQIDCDAGQRLDKALLAVKNSPGARIQVRGTCAGWFELTTDSVRLEAWVPGEATLTAPDPTRGGTVLTVRDARDVMIYGIRFRHGGDIGVGVEFFRSPGGGVLECEFERSEVGLVFNDSHDGWAWEISAHDNDIGMTSEYGSDVGIHLSTFERNRRNGVVAFDDGSLLLERSKVNGNGQAGVVVAFNSRADVAESSLNDNGQVHLFVGFASQLTVRGDAVVGSPSDATWYALDVYRSSTADVGNSTLYGDIEVTDNAFLDLDVSRALGHIRVDRFGRASLFNTTVTGSAGCASGGDLICGYGTHVTVSGCPSATSCSPALSDETTTVVPERHSLSPPYLPPRRSRR